MVRFFLCNRSLSGVPRKQGCVAWRFFAPAHRPLEAGYPHVRRRCRQHAQVAETLKATVRCDAQVVPIAKTPTAFPSIPPGAVTALTGGAASLYFEDITMPASTSSNVLYRIDECPDLMADGCIGDEHGNLWPLS